MVDMGKRRLVLSVALLAMATLVFVVIQYLLLTRSYELEKKNFSFTTQRLLSEVFFQVQRPDDRLTGYVAEWLGQHHPRQFIDVKLKERLRSVLSEYDQIAPRLRARYLREGLTIGFNLAITVESFVLFAKDGQETWIDEETLHNELSLFGDGDVFQTADFNTSFSLTHPLYFHPHSCPFEL